LSRLFLSPLAGVTCNEPAAVSMPETAFEMHDLVSSVIDRFQLCFGEKEAVYQHFFLIHLPIARSRFVSRFASVENKDFDGIVLLLE
jgi:hypothetical protein